MKDFKTMMMTLGLASTFALGACGGDIDKANKIVDELCACKDVACLTGVQSKLSEMAELKVSESDGEKLMKKVEGCTATIMKNIAGSVGAAAE